MHWAAEAVTGESTGDSPGATPLPHHVLLTSCVSESGPEIQAFPRLPGWLCDEAEVQGHSAGTELLTEESPAGLTGRGCWVWLQSVLQRVKTPEAWKGLFQIQPAF